MHFYRKCWFDPFEEQFKSHFLSDCPSLMLGIAIHCIQHSQAMLERGVCELAHSFFHFSCSWTCVCQTNKRLFQTIFTIFIYTHKPNTHGNLFRCRFIRNFICNQAEELSFGTFFNFIVSDLLIKRNENEDFSSP